MILLYLLTSLAVAQTPCTWEGTGHRWASVKVMTVVQREDEVSLPFAINTWHAAPHRTGVTLGADGVITLDLEDESVRLKARLADDEAILHPDALVELGGGLSVAPSGVVRVVGVASAGVRVTASLNGYLPTTSVGAVLPCERLSLTGPTRSPEVSGTPADIVTGEHVLRATPGGEVLGTLTRGTGSYWNTWTGERAGDEVRVELWQGGVGLTGWLPASATAPWSGASGVGGILGALREEPPSTLSCGGGAVSLLSKDGATSALGELNPGAIVEVVGPVGGHQAIGLPGAVWLQPGSNRLGMHAEALAACAPASAAAVAAARADKGLVGTLGTQATSASQTSSESSSRIGGDPIILGSLDKQLIDAVIKRNMNQVRYCYQRELKKSPKLAGKITVKFIIASDGSVSKADTKATTMNNATVEGCINERVLKFQFPEPKGGGIVIVSYPFIFSPG